MFTSLNDTVTYNNGVKSPIMAYGTWKMPDDESGEECVKTALSLGYRHIDTAAGYGNEESVGRGIAESGIPREEIFVTTKLFNPDRGYDRVRQAFELSRKKLGLNQIDLYLMHWPNPPLYRRNYETYLAESWKAMEDLCKEGLVRAIGISNFYPRHLKQLQKTMEIVPAANQMYLCPGQTQEDTAAVCADMGIVLQAYSPLANGKVFEMPEMLKMAEKYQKTVAQTALRWAVQMGYQVLTKSFKASRIKENVEIYDFEISEEDMRFISKAKGAGESHNPDTETF